VAPVRVQTETGTRRPDAPRAWAVGFVCGGCGMLLPLMPEPQDAVAEAPALKR
jgi:hypothetical protein